MTVKGISVCDAGVVQCHYLGILELRCDYWVEQRRSDARNQTIENIENIAYKTWS